MKTINNFNYKSVRWLLIYLFIFKSFFVYSDTDPLPSIGGIIKLMRFLRFASFFPALKEYMYAYYQTLFTIGGVLFNLVFFMIFYAILGMNLFKGLLEFRCRTTEEPPKTLSEWPIEASSSTLCGVTECPEK